MIQDLPLFICLMRGMQRMLFVDLTALNLAGKVVDSVLSGQR